MSENTNTGAGLSPRELWDQQNEQARHRLDELAATVTQRDWLLICKALDKSRAEIGADTGLTLLALGWVLEKRAHGGASWDRLLDMTDAELEDLHGFAPGDGSDLSTERPVTQPAVVDDEPPAPGA